MSWTFDSFLYLWLTIAVGTFLLLFFIDAPYGRHNRSGWGPQVDNKLGWIVMELVSPIVLLFFFFRGESNKNWAVVFFMSLWVFHYAYRSIYFPLKTNTEGKTIPLSIVLMAVFFNSVNGFTNGFFFGNFAEQYADFSLSNPQAMFGLFLFIIGFYIHSRSDHILISLRKNNSEYVVPNQFLFKYVASPNYLGEMLEWLGFAILTSAFSAWCFWAWTIANLLPRALANYRWYRAKFDDYPKHRKALIPGLF